MRSTDCPFGEHPQAPASSSSIPNGRGEAGCAASLQLKSFQCAESSSVSATPIKFLSLKAPNFWIRESRDWINPSFRSKLYSSIRISQRRIVNTIWCGRTKNYTNFRHSPHIPHVGQTGAEATRPCPPRGAIFRTLVACLTNRILQRSRRGAERYIPATPKWISLRNSHV